MTVIAILLPIIFYGLAAHWAITNQKGFAGMQFKNLPKWLQVYGRTLLIAIGCLIGYLAIDTLIRFIQLT
ncbi:hypothetical protein PXH69_24490 [Rhodococcus qingshengii]|uniref:DUF1146 domain-containing protein n=1 Tax=Rhodococcus qingshengii TaxID=334542 RepID=A0AAW6LRX5_RHOSG|nr:hypothetical protein [Rhodococcus qingshengii]MDE8648130.1 hypothetical protein [Rhodococcus qingshengii]